MRSDTDHVGSGAGSCHHEAAGVHIKGCSVPDCLLALAEQLSTKAPILTVPRREHPMNPLDLPERDFQVPCKL